MPEKTIALATYKRRKMSQSVRFAVLRRDGFRCQYCGARAPDAKLQVDHIHPVSKGGSDDMSNLTTACSHCNIGKGTGSVQPSGVIFEPVCSDPGWHVDSKGEQHLSEHYWDESGWQDAISGWIDIVREWDGQEPIV